MFMLFGWATGGIIFGMLSDKIGRVRTMVATLLMYSGSPVSLAAHTDGWILRFTVSCRMGVGGMFAAATTLVAEACRDGSAHWRWARSSIIRDR